ncbi:hypothetical protein FY557_13380 [Chryseobacterium sp. SN22]|uniref:hypothetical protein n=1 Tax=Chryseobacterium sp. SN22 TaxID=2606431 RepID=UPI0011EFF8A0|nr:hypothetical protein [Chryseobacterium sp. SN22]KAA0127361.1 hypothetical protein FY557_13380 [Chryseobacterium sp. SN22]
MTILFWILALSCKAPVSSYQNNRVTLVSAEKSAWSGGRPGIRGILYTVALKSENSKDHITVKTFRAEGNTVSFRQIGSGNTASVKGNFQMADETNNFTYPSSGVPAEKPVILNQKDSWIEYTLNDSGKKYRIVIPEFTTVEPEGELIPRRP